MLSFSQKQFATLIRNLPSVTQPNVFSLQCVSPVNSFSLQLPLRQLTSSYFKMQRPRKFHNRYRHLKYKRYRCTVVPRFVTLYSVRLYLPLLPPDIYDSAVVVYNNIYLLQLGCYPVAVVILHVNKHETGYY